MAQKRSIPADPPVASSSEEDFVSEEGESEEKEKELVLHKKKAQSSSSKPASLASVSATSTKASGKRPVEEISGIEKKYSKRAKKDTDSEAKKPFQRLWSEDDEIVILKGMIDFASKKGTDVSDFQEFIKKSLHFDFTRVQLTEKMRKLKRKYLRNATKGKNGEDCTFSNPHEQKAYDLSKKIWGSQGGAAIDHLKSNGKAKKVQKKDTDLTSTPAVKDTEKSSTLVGKDTQKNSSPALKDESLAAPPSSKDEKMKEVTENLLNTLFHSKSIVAEGLESNLLEEGLLKIDGAKRIELDEKCRALHMDEAEVSLKRINFIRELTSLVLAAYKKQ